MTDSIRIRELAAQTGLPTHTLRYYEQVGLMIPVPRDSAHRRVYSDDHLRWVQFLLQLRESGMGIAQIREYVLLLRSDSPNRDELRLEMLRRHRDEVRARIDRLTQHLAVVSRKVDAGCDPENPPPTLGEE